MAFHYGGTSRDEGKTFDIFCLEVCIFQAGYFFTSYVAVLEGYVFHEACRMADKCEGLTGIGPADILQEDTLDGSHPAVAIAFSFRKDDFKVLVFDVRFDPYVLEGYVLDF